MRVSVLVRPPTNPADGLCIEPAEDGRRLTHRSEPQGCSGRQRRRSQTQCEKTFTFDRVLPNATHRQLFDDFKPLLAEFLAGFNVPDLDQSQQCAADL